MLEKPAIEAPKLIACLITEYGLPIIELNFLPLGADFNTAVYRAKDRDGIAYFVKLRRKVFEPISVDVPKFLHDQGLTEIISPIKSLAGTLSVKFHMFDAIIYPFVDGKSAWEVPLSESQWHIFGKALRKIHNTNLPNTLANRMRHENYNPRFRQKMRKFQSQIEQNTFIEASAKTLARLLMEQKSVINHIVQRAEYLAAILKAQSPELVLCHSDIHMGNLLSDDEKLYIVDWDQPILAPKERDLMFIGGGVGGTQHPPEQEEAWFYAGYGQPKVNPIALAYYRYERIVHDLTEYCEQLLLSDEGGEDRKNSLCYFQSQFLPGNVIEMAYRTEKLLPKEFKRA